MRMPEEVEAEWREMQYRMRVEASGLTPADLEKTFDTFDASANPQAYAVAKAYAEKYEKGLGVGLLFWGPAGVGKTHLAMAIANVLLRRGFQVRRWAMADLLAHARSAFADQESETIQTLFQTLATSDVVILDDLNLQTLASAYEIARACEFLFRVVDTCLSHRTALILTTNHSPRELQARLAQLDGNSERIFSRLREMVWPVEMKGANMRPKARQARTPAWLLEALGKEVSG